MDGIAGVHARIAQIQSMFSSPAGGAGGVLGSHDPASDAAVAAATGGGFADALANAQASSSPASALAPAGSGTVNRAGVDSAQWARDFLTKINMPITSENVRAITAWEQAEGTAAHFNPLATTQSGYSGETRFNSVGVKNYVQYQDGIDANAKAITNGLYDNVLAALQAGNSAEAVAQAIANSPWGTHDGVLRVLHTQR